MVNKPYKDKLKDATGRQRVQCPTCRSIVSRFLVLEGIYDS